MVFITVQIRFVLSMSFFFFLFIFIFDFKFDIGCKAMRTQIIFSPVSAYTLLLNHLSSCESPIVSGVGLEIFFSSSSVANITNQGQIL